MKLLTKAEEQIMQSIWQLDAAFLKQIVEAQPLPKPHSNTVATILKILAEKGFVGITPIGRMHRYYPIVSKAAYTSGLLVSLVKGYFEGSFKGAITFMLHQKFISSKELDAMLHRKKNKK